MSHCTVLVTGNNEWITKPNYLILCKLWSFLSFSSTHLTDLQGFANTGIDGGGVNVFSVGLHTHLAGKEESLRCVLCCFTHPHLAGKEESLCCVLLVYTHTWLVRTRVCVVFSVGLHIHLAGKEESFCCVLGWFTHPLGW